MKKIFVTGGAGFIGSAVVREAILKQKKEVVVIDKLTYAGSLENLHQVKDSPLFHFEKIDICDTQALLKIFEKYQPEGVMHLAAESHVDRSIDGPEAFIQTNIVGTYRLLEAARCYWRDLTDEKKPKFRFHHISTDEVFGSLNETGLFTETSPYQPNSPYSASKASSDHLVRAWHETYKLPIVITNCSNNYGPYHFPEKLIPLTILNALEGKPLPVYGKGENIRDWLHVEDHARALLLVLDKGVSGESYNIGGHNEETNIEVVKKICTLVDELAKNKLPKPRQQLIQFVSDRPGHDLRYAIDASKIQRELGWVPEETFESGLKKTVQWFLENASWCEKIQSDKDARARIGTKI